MYFIYVKTAMITGELNGVKKGVFERTWAEIFTAFGVSYVCGCVCMCVGVSCVFLNRGEHQNTLGEESQGRVEEEKVHMAN